MAEHDEAERAAMVRSVLDAASPVDRLLDHLQSLEAKQDLHTAVALFESLLWRLEMRHYWVYFRMARAYADLGRLEAAFLMAAQAVRMQPDWPATRDQYRAAFRYFADHGRSPEAVELFLAHAGHSPEQSLVEPHEIQPLLDAAGISLTPAAPPDGPAAALRIDHRVFEAEDRAPTPVAFVGRFLPQGLQWVGGPLRRLAIDVAELPGGELLICNDAVVVCRADGAIEPELSICPFPELVRRKIERADMIVETREVAEAVLILDVFPPPNLGHFLLDQISRLELYRRAGADLGRAVVVGPEIHTGYQREILARAGISGVLNTSRIMRLRAGRLWVSSNCRGLQHPAHLGADWAIDYARTLLGGRGEAGHRRLYLSRGDASGRQLVNEAALIEILAPLGFEVVTPGAMSYADQLAAFRDASHIVAVHGAALAHLVLCAPGTRVLELFHPLYATWAYAILARDCGLDHTAAVGFDAVSDAPEFNDPAHYDSQTARFGNRNLRADLDAVREWMARVA